MTGLSLENPAYFDRLAKIEAEHWWSRGLWRLSSHWLDRALCGRQGLVAIDIGCGAGGTARRLGNRPEVDRVLALDPSPEAISRAFRHGAGGLLQASAISLPFADQSVDLATSFDVIQHLGPQEDQLALREIHRVLRPGGLALIRSNGRGGWNGPKSEGPYDLKHLEAIIQNAKLKVIRSTYANCLPALAQELRGWLRNGSRAAGHPAGGGLRIELPPRWLNHCMGWVARMEAFAAGTIGLRLPFGHSTLVLARKSEIADRASQNRRKTV